MQAKLQALLDFLNSPVPPWLWALVVALVVAEVIAYLFLRRLRSRARDYEATEYLFAQLEKIYFCGYDEFWQYGVTQQFYEKLQNPHTSWLIWELMSVYTLYCDDHPSIFCKDIAELTLEPQNGEHINFGLFYYYPEIVFPRRIMHQMMQRPARTRPKAHTMRQVQYYQKQVQDYFDKKFVEAHEEELLRREVRSDQKTEQKAS